MEFDIRTLLVAVTLATAFCAGARFLLCRLHPTLPGLDRWAVASVLAAIALGLIATHGKTPAAASLTLPQLLIAAGFILSWDGFRRFADRAPLSRATLAAVSVSAALAIAASHFTGSLSLRAVFNSAVVAALSAAIARDLITGAQIGTRIMRGTGCLYAANALFFLARIAAAFHADEVWGHDISSGISAATLLWWLCCQVGITLGMVLMAGERLQRDLDRQASLDPLTGALNRRAFGQMAAREIAHARRNGEKLSLLMMDLDHFKQINDQLGHAAGDQALCLFVAVAGRALRQEDLFCRFGGEEFVALLPGSDHAAALVAAERLRQTYADEAATLNAPFPLTVSIGVAEMHGAEDLEAATKRSDAALYRAKAAGRNRSEVADIPSQAFCPQPV